MSLDNFLEGRTIYAFGDSIVYGHTHPEYCFMRQIQELFPCNLRIYAVNGATVIDSDNAIRTQVENAPATSPDFIVWNGFTNDCYARNESHLGAISEGFDGPFDTTTLCGGFENIIHLMKTRWPNARIIYVAIHRSNARLDTIQYKGETAWVQRVMQDLTHEMCRKWGIRIADLWNNSPLDTNLPGYADKYIIDGSGSHPNRAACAKYYAPIVTEALRLETAELERKES